ncbi:hypothetical protein, partial [Deinococcus sp. GbtcB9]|uniref:hypothetical protein n=1 Tax=Deinococcus sp. GbtcB9 TaxID=2824754 RepID=UPI001C2FDB22
YTKEEWYHELSTGMKNNEYIGDHVQNDIVDANQERVLSFVKNIKDTNNLANPTLAYLLIDFKTKTFERLIANKAETQSSSYMI